MWNLENAVVVGMMVEFEDGNGETLLILQRTLSSHCLN